MKSLLLSVLFICYSFNLFSQENQVLRWAADAESGAPYVFQDPRIPTKLIGFEVDIINAISNELGMENKHFQNQWDGLIPGLKRNDYDLAKKFIQYLKENEKDFWVTTMLEASKNAIQQREK